MKAPGKAKDVLTEAVATLKASTAIDHWQRDREEIEAEELLAYALGVDGVAPNDEVPPNVRRTFDRMIARRGAGEPVQLITGQAVFRGLQIAARPGVFVPRDSTEYLAEQAVRRLRGRRRPVAVDLATGGGTVALAIANEVPGVRVFGTDISLTAIRVARENAELLHLRATFAKGDLFGGLPSELKGRVDVITLHPPYVARDEKVFADVVMRAFGQRRKTLRNTLRGKLDASDFAKLEIDPAARGESLAVRDFVNIANRIARTER